MNPPVYLEFLKSHGQGNPMSPAVTLRVGRPMGSKGAKTAVLEVVFLLYGLEDTLFLRFGS